MVFLLCSPDQSFSQSARPLLGPPHTLLFECPRLVNLSLLNLAQSSKEEGELENGVLDEGTSDRVWKRSNLVHSKSGACAGALYNFCCD